MNAATWKYGLQTNQVFEVDSGEQICSVVRDMFTRDQYTAHGNLLAAAPELMEALETLTDRVLDLGTNGISQEIAKARTAIQKAKGLTPKYSSNA